MERERYIYIGVLGLERSALHHHERKMKMAISNLF
jgi:hypothetical protein